MPTFIQLLLCDRYNIGEARHQLFPRRPCCHYFQTRKLSPEPWHNLLIAGVRSWDFNLQLSDCLAQVFFSPTVRDCWEEDFKKNIFILVCFILFILLPLATGISIQLTPKHVFLGISKDAKHQILHSHFLPTQRITESVLKPSLMIIHWDLAASLFDCAKWFI